MGGGVGGGSHRAWRLPAAPATAGKRKGRATAMASTSAAKASRESTSHRRGNSRSKSPPHLFGLPHGVQGVGLGFLRVPTGLHQGVGVVGQVVLEFLGHGVLFLGGGVAEAGADGLDIGHLPGVDTGPPR